MINATINLEDLFYIFNASGLCNEESSDIPKDSLYIDSPNGYVPVRALVSKTHEAKKYILESGEYLKCSTKHIIFNEGVDTFIDDASYVDVIGGTDKIIDTENLGTMKLYDVALDYPHQYVTPNKVIHHNTSLIHVLINSIDKIDESDVMILNMSDEGVDAVRDKILPFCQTISFGSYKVVVLEEFEMCSQKGQGSLKRIMEDYSDVVRFLITSNAANKILPPIRSRCQEIAIEKHDHEQFMTRILEILIQEEIDVESEGAIDIVDRYVRACWPDFRKTINVLESQCVNGKLLEMNDGTASTAGFESQIITALQTGTLSQTRKMIVENITDDMVDSFFSYLYRNLDLWIPENLDQDRKDEMVMKLILKIRTGAVNDSLVADREINLSSTLVELQMVQLEYL